MHFCGWLRARFSSFVGFGAVRPDRLDWRKSIAAWRLPGAGVRNHRLRRQAQIPRDVSRSRWWSGNRQLRSL